MMGRLRRSAGRWWLALLLLAAWQALAHWRILNPLFFPPPSKLLALLPSLIASGELARHLGWTLARSAAGYFSGVFAGILISVLLCSSQRLRRAAEPVIAALYASPRLTLLPMVMLIFGVNEFARVLLVAVATLLVVVIQVSDAVRSVDPDYVQLATNYGAGRGTVIRRVYLPACLPQTFTALRLAFGRALVLTITIELVSCDAGLGSMIWSAWQTFATERLYIGVMVAGALGMLLQTALEKLERVVVPWGSRRT